MSASRSPLRLVALSCHAVLLLGVTGWALSAFASVPARLIMLGVAVLPLLVTLPGLVKGQRASAQWLALLLVIYAGAAVVEVIASLGTAWFGSLALLAALVELGLLLAIIRRA